MFAQHHPPGRQGQPDYTYMNNVSVQIPDQRFDHLLNHFTLTYSDWESVTVCFSKSFESLSCGGLNTLWEPGAVPEVHRTGCPTGLVNNLSEVEGFTGKYQARMRQYGMRPSHNNPGLGQENGDDEQLFHRMKRAVSLKAAARTKHPPGDSQSAQWMAA